MSLSSILKVLLTLRGFLDFDFKVTLSNRDLKKLLRLKTFIFSRSEKFDRRSVPQPDSSSFRRIPSKGSQEIQRTTARSQTR